MSTELDAEDLLRRLGLAIKRINALEIERTSLLTALKGLADRITDVEPFLHNALLLEYGIHGQKYKGPGWKKHLRAAHKAITKAEESQ